MCNIARAYCWYNESLFPVPREKVANAVTCSCRWHIYYSIFIRSAFWYRYNDAALQIFLANLMILHPHLYFIRVHHFLMMVLAPNIAIAVWPYFCTYFMGYLFIDHCEWVIIQFVVIPEMVKLQNIRNTASQNVSLVYKSKIILTICTFLKLGN